jgi:hypothetical protein
MHLSPRAAALAALLAAGGVHATDSDMAISVFCNTPLDFLAGYGDSFAVVTPPSHGSAEFTDNTLRYTPALGYSGLDTFYYQYHYPTDPGLSGMLVYVTVRACQMPVAQDASLDVPYETATPLSLTATDANPGGPFQFSYVIVAPPAHGNVEIHGDVATYTPATGYAGTDAFTYAATTVNGTSAPASVAVTIGPSPAQLALSIDDGRDTVHYGQWADYSVTLANNGGSTAASVAVDFSLSNGFDADFAYLACFGDGDGASCVPDATDPLHFIVTLPPGRSLAWLVDVPVRENANVVTVDLGVTADGAAPAIDSNVVAIFRDGFDAAGGDGTPTPSAE